MKNILLVIVLVFNCNFLNAQTGKVENGAIKYQSEQKDFEDKVQMPFSTAYRIFKDQIKELSGSEHNAIGFLDRIPDSLNPVDSLKAALYVQTYINASISYRIATIEWICTHMDSFKVPSLIVQWWPSEGWELAYNALPEKVKTSSSGKNLKGLIEKFSKNNFKK